MTEFMTQNKEIDLFHIKRMLKQGAYGPSLLSKYREEFKSEIAKKKKEDHDLRESCEKMKTSDLHTRQDIKSSKKFPHVHSRRQIDFEKYIPKPNLLPLNQFSLPKVKENEDAVSQIKSSKSGYSFNLNPQKTLSAFLH